VEEKIIERADRKLFLDAAVIQQGRLAEQNSSLQKDELMKMIRFGADQVLSGKGGTYTDEDIDALIAKGEERTSEIQAKLQTDAKHNLADFKLLPDTDGGKDTFSFDGKNYRSDGAQTVGNFINLPQVSAFVFELLMHDSHCHHSQLLASYRPTNVFVTNSARGSGTMMSTNTSVTR
jgi:SWI/SNF-related matrix-associated actin-dependent regulator of chromatin subfamily A member 5